MIKSKRPNTADEYGDIGFIQAKVGDEYKNIDHIYDSDGNIVFQQGYLNEYQGADDFSIPAIGKPLVDYTIYGNTKQDGLPTPDSPIEPEFVGERTGNLFDKTTLGNGIYLAANGNKYGNVTNGVRSDVKIKALPNTAYTLSVQSTAIVSLRILEWSNGTFVKQTPKYNISGDISLTVTTDAETAEIAFNIEGANAQYATNIMLNFGTEALPHEPYGYKIPITSGGNNLLDFEQLKNAPPGKIGTADVPHLLILQMKPNTYYTIASNGYGSIYATPADLYRSIYVNRSIGEYSVNKSNPITVLTDDSGNVNIGFFDDRTNAQQYLNGEAQVWINEGSIPLPYEPYIEPINTNIYLEEVESTRKIKKLVLTGEEIWGKDANFDSIDDYFYTDPISGLMRNSSAISSHFISGSRGIVDSVWIGGSASAPRIVVEISKLYTGVTSADDRAARISKFKSYLSAQYAAGTPVTVWYVLATPETAIVNEPLCRIGDYADSVDFSQAGVEIPTLKKPSTTVIDVETSVEPSEIDVTYRGSTKPKYDLFLAKNGDSFEAKDGQSLYIGGNP